jgi:hypothetical protein
VLAQEALLLILIVDIPIVIIVLMKDTSRCCHRALVDMKLELLHSRAIANQVRKLAHRGSLSSYCYCFQLIVVCQYDDSQYGKPLRLRMRGAVNMLMSHPCYHCCCLCATQYSKAIVHPVQLLLLMDRFCTTSPSYYCS